MKANELISTIEFLTRAISGDEESSVQALPQAGGEQTLVLTAPEGMGRLLGKGGETFKALRRVINAASWRTGISFRLVISDPRTKLNRDMCDENSNKKLESSWRGASKRSS